MCESADKPGSVLGNHSSWAYVAINLMQPTRTQCEQHYQVPIWPCSRWGLPCHGMLPPMRCALTAPFHPYRRGFYSNTAVSFLLHFPWTHAPQELPGTLLYGARTFLYFHINNMKTAIAWPTHNAIIEHEEVKYSFLIHI